MRYLNNTVLRQPVVSSAAGNAHRRRTLLGVFGLLLAGVVGTIMSPAASAHSYPVSSDPANGATVQHGPPRVTITFNEALQDSFAVLTVVGPDGHYWQDGSAAVSGARLSTGLRELGPAGTYTLNYRVTSADGHPVSGKRTFVLATAGHGTPGPKVGSDNGGGGTPVWPFIVVAIVVLAGGLGVVAWLTRRPGRSSSAK